MNKRFMRLCGMAAILLMPPAALYAAEWHVAVTGKDSQRGAKDDPLRTIQRAATGMLAFGMHLLSGIAPAHG